MSVQEIFRQVEEYRLTDTTAEVKKIFEKVWLPSHDYIHHLRVWNFAKEIVLAYRHIDFNFDFNYLEALFVACLFHDTGFSVTIDEKHGKESKKLTLDYLHLYPLKSDVYLHEMLEAIVLHDDKTYGSEKSTQQIPGIYQILTVADDLDALGALGLYRYFEIYNSRGLDIRLMQSRIEKNIKSRIKFIRNKLEFNEILIQKHYERYQRAFFYLKLLSLNDVNDIVNLFNDELTLDETIIFQNFTHSTKLHDFLCEVLVEEADLIRSLPNNLS